MSAPTGVNVTVLSLAAEPSPSNTGARAWVSSSGPLLWSHHRDDIGVLVGAVRIGIRVQCRPGSRLDEQSGGGTIVRGCVGGAVAWRRAHPRPAAYRGERRRPEGREPPGRP